MIKDDVVDTSKIDTCKQICNNAGGLVSHMLWKHDKRVDADGVEQGSSKKVNEEQGGSQQQLLLVDDGDPENVVTIDSMNSRMRYGSKHTKIYEIIWEMIKVIVWLQTRKYWFQS